jgi:signal recognition particle GTPase
LAYDALSRARAESADVLLIDTAGRLHNKAALMEELRKIVRVLRKLDETVPHSVLMTLDATTGQNAIQQVKVFKEMVDVTGLAVTKLDGSARGGIVVALAETFGLPIHAAWGRRRGICGRSSPGISPGDSSVWSDGRDRSRARGPGDGHPAVDQRE